MRYMVITVPGNALCGNLLDIVDKKSLQGHIGFTRFNSDLGASLLASYPDAGIGNVIDTEEDKILSSFETAALLRSLI